MPPIVCFLDDSTFELEVFAECIVPSAPGLEFVLGSDYLEVRDQLGGRYPCLFLLDLYGRDPELPPAVLPRGEDIQAEVERLGSLDQIYAGLDVFPGDVVNEYLKRLFHMADGWRQIFRRAARAAGQSIAYGLGNLALARRDYPAAAAIGYTRKSTIQDAVAALAAGIDGLNLKPDGPTDQAIRQTTREAAPELLTAWSNLITRGFINYLKDLSLLLARSGLSGDLPRLHQPETLSPEAQALIGPGDKGFLETSALWREYLGPKAWW